MINSSLPTLTTQTRLNQPTQPTQPKPVDLTKEFESRIASWGLSADASRSSMTQIQQRIQAKQAILQSPETKLVRNFSNLFSSISAAPSLGKLISPKIKAQDDALAMAELKADIDLLDSQYLEQALYTMLYEQLPLLIQASTVTSADQAMQMLRATNVLDETAISEVRTTIDDMLQFVLPIDPTESEQQGIIDNPTWVLPKPPPPRLMDSVHDLTIEELERTIQPAPPESRMSEDQWNQTLTGSGWSDADLEEINKIKLQAEEIADAWTEWGNQLDAYAEAKESITDFSLWETLKIATVVPGIALLDIANVYFEHVSMPIAGTIYRQFIPDLEAEYQKHRNKGSGAWESASLAWDDWHANWFLKYMVMEGLVDPTTYIGWGLAGRIVGTTTKFGKMVNAVDKGFMHVTNLPFDMIKAGLNEFPKTMIQRAGLAQARISSTVGKAVTKLTGKTIKNSTPAEFNQAIDNCVALAQLTPHSENDIARAGKELLLHAPIDEEAVSRWSKAINIDINPESVSVSLLEQVDDIFEDMFWKKTDKVLTAPEAATELVRRLGGEQTEANIAVMQKLLEKRSTDIVNNALSFSKMPSPFKAMQAIGDRGYKTHMKIESSKIFKAKEESGRLLTFITDLEPKNMARWRHGIDRVIVKTFAEAYLTFGAYGPMNVLEDYMRSALGGVFPRRMLLEDWELATVGIRVDPQLSHLGISDYLGPLFRKGEGFQHDNWILQLSTLGNKDWSSKLYEGMVRLPGAFGADIRRNFVWGRYKQILRETGGEAYEKLVRAVPDIPTSGVFKSKKLRRQMDAAIQNAITTGDLNAVARIPDLFHVRTITRAELDDILKLFPELSAATRRLIYDAFDEGELFKSVTHYSDYTNQQVADELYLKYREPKLGSAVELPHGYSLSTPKEMVRTEGGVETWVELLNPQGEKAGRIMVNETPEALRVVHIEIEPDELRRGLATAFYKETIWKRATETGKVLETDIHLRTPQGTRFFEGLKSKGIVEEISRQGDIVTYRVIDTIDHRYTIPLMETSEGKLLKDITFASNSADFMTVKKEMEKAYRKYNATLPDGYVSAAELETRGLDSIESVMEQARVSELDEFLQSPELASQQYEELTKILTDFQVENPSQMAHLMQQLNFMTDRYGETPRQILANATVRSRGLPHASRHAAIEADMDRLENFLLKAGVQIDQAAKSMLEKSKKLKLTPTADKKISKYINAITEKQIKTADFRQLNRAYRTNKFATASPHDLKSDEWWQRFYSELDMVHSEFDQNMTELNGRIVNLAQDAESAMGKKARARSPIKITDRPIAVADVGRLIGARGDDMSKAILNNLTSFNDREGFITYVMANVKDYDKGFNRKSVGTIYDELVHGLNLGDAQVTWMTAKNAELAGVRRELHQLHTTKILDPSQFQEITGYVDKVYKSVSETMYESAPAKIERTKVIDRATGNTANVRQLEDGSFVPVSEYELAQAANADLKTGKLDIRRPFDWDKDSLPGIQAKLSSRENSAVLFDYLGQKKSAFEDLASIMGEVTGDLIDPFFGSGAFPLTAKTAGLVKGKIRAGELSPVLNEVYSTMRSQPDQVLAELDRLYAEAGGIIEKELAIRMKNGWNAGEFEGATKAAVYHIISHNAVSNNLRINYLGKITGGMKNPTKSFSFGFAQTRRNQLERGMKALKDVSLEGKKATDYLSMIKSAKSGDTVFLDPPYHQRNPSATYAGKVSGDEWTEESTTAMIDAALEAQSKGAKIIVTDSLASIKMYEDAGFKITTRTNTVGQTVQGKTTSEIIATLGFDPITGRAFSSKTLTTAQKKKLRSKGFDGIKYQVGTKTHWVPLNKNQAKPKKWNGETKIGKPLALKEEFKDIDDIRQKAMDEANKWYYKEYPDYTNANAFDAMMKNIYPYWTYESQRWFWIPKTFLTKPGTFTAWGRWQDNTDYGYINIPGTDIDINPARGTVWGTLSTRLMKRDYPEYADSLPGMKGAIEYNDSLTRRGFYPGAHIAIPMALFGGQETQLGETIPAVWKTPLNALIALFPDNKSVAWISEHIFHDNFRDYLTKQEVVKRGGDGKLINAKINQDMPLTPEEQSIWNDARRTASLYGMLFEQTGVLALHPAEKKAMYEQSSKVIAEWTGISPMEQEYLQKHGENVIQRIGGLSPTQQDILKELDRYRWAGLAQSMLPSRQQKELEKLELDWDNIEKFVESKQANKLTLESQFQSGILSTDAYLSGMSTIQAEQRTYIDQKMIENPGLTLQGRLEYFERYDLEKPVMHPMRELTALYFEIELEDKYDEELGEIVKDWDGFWASRNAIEQAVPDQYKAEWEDYLARNLTKTEQIRKYVSETYFSKYNEVWDAVLAMHSESEQALIKEFYHLQRTQSQLVRQEEIKATPSSTFADNQLISGFTTEISNSKQALRRANPTLDAWLFYWGRTTSFQTDSAETTFNRLMHETGRTQ